MNLPTDVMQYQVNLENLLIKVCQENGISRDNLVEMVIDFDQRIEKGNVIEEPYARMRSVSNRFMKFYVDKLNRLDPW